VKIDDSAKKYDFAIALNLCVFLSFKQAWIN
jgi:hypothetical protein